MNLERKWDPKLNCNYHLREKRTHCGHNCPIHGAFDNDEYLERVLDVFGGRRSLFPLFIEGRSQNEKEQRDAGQRESVVQAMFWTLRSWIINPITGPFGEFLADQRKIEERVKKGFVIGPNSTFVREDLSVPFRPFIDPGRNTICRFHSSGGRGGCVDEFVYRLLFPAYSDEGAFNIIYNMFARNELGYVRSFFKEEYDYVERRSVAAALAWDAECWELDPINGPRGRCEEQKRILHSLGAPAGYIILLGNLVKKESDEGVAAGVVEGNGEGAI